MYSASCYLSFVSFFFFMLSRPPISTLFPYTTLFRSDTEYEGKEILPEYLEYIHTNKTGALLKLCVRMGAILAGCSDKELDRKSTRLNSSHVAISYAVFCLKKKINNKKSNQAEIARTI